MDLLNKKGVHFFAIQTNPKGRAKHFGYFIVKGPPPFELFYPCQFLVTLLLTPIGHGLLLV
jgi:hypothetical protein